METLHLQLSGRGVGGMQRKKQLSGFQIQIFVQRSWTRPQLPPNTGHLHEAVVFAAIGISTGKSVSSLNLQCS